MRVYDFHCFKRIRLDDLTNQEGFGFGAGLGDDLLLRHVALQTSASRARKGWIGEMYT